MINGLNKCICECQYCGHKWMQIFWSKDAADKAKCPKCGDDSLKIGPFTSLDVYGYNKE